MFVFFRVIASIFYQILYMSIVASIIGLVILMIQKIINKRISPKYNYYIWLVFILILVFPISIFSKFSIYNHINVNIIKIINVENNDKIDRVLNDNDISTIIPDASLNNISMFGINIKIIIANILLMLSLIQVCITCFSMCLLKKKFSEISLENERIINIVDECKKELGIKKDIKIINQNIVDSPAIIGLFDVKILFSNNLLLLDDVSLKNMFLHEFAHYKRKDNFMNFLIMILSSIYWFNPIIKFIFKYIKQDIEFATDELAIKNMNLEETREYCRTIVEAEARSSKFAPILTFAGELEYIDKRIDFISFRNKFKKFSKVIAISTIFIVIFLCLVFYPTSYCNTTIPKLYFQTDDGLYEEIPIVNGNDKEKEISIKEGVNTQIISDNLSKNSYIYFNSSSINNTENYEEKTSIILNNNIKYLKKGNYLCNFTVVTKNKKVFEYVIKIKVI